MNVQGFWKLYNGKEVGILSNTMDKSQGLFKVNNKGNKHFMSD